MKIKVPIFITIFEEDKRRSKIVDKEIDKELANEWLLFTQLIKQVVPNEEQYNIFVDGRK